MEAIACGTPVVGINAGALPETINTGETGHLYERGNIDSFTAALETAISDLSNLRESCLEHREALGVERTLKTLADLYDDIQ
ncbi:Glycosyl transferases group 1 [Halorientalis persicus]|uniref:Glycosyl transferases group 1 n=2 Tax=Halorientalis persicus TaxID=1367881 RepID=A0A1H8WE07_9EURY|nr:Glycosyl transferases group 1 [Halorientalis persicus]